MARVKLRSDTLNLSPDSESEKSERELIAEHQDKLLLWDVLQVSYVADKLLDENEIAERCGMEVEEVQRILVHIKRKFKEVIPDLDFPYYPPML